MLAVAGLGVMLWWLTTEHGSESGATGDMAPAVVATRALREGGEAGALPTALPEPATAEGSAPLAPEPTTAVPLDEGDVRVPFTGRVIDQAGRPVAGALVHHYPSPWTRQKQHMLTSFAATLEPASLAYTTTDASGRFTLDVIDHPPDRGAVVAPAGTNSGAGGGERIPSLLVMHAAFATRIVPCLGWKGDAYDAGDIALAPGAALFGRAVDEDGRPLAGVSVTPPLIGGPYGGPGTGDWWLLKPTLFALTGADGRFAFDGLWTGAANFDLRLAGFRTVRLDVQLQGGTSHDAGDIVLHPGAMIDGQVVDAEGRPVSKAHLLARPAGLMDNDFGNSDAVWQFNIRMSLQGGLEADVDLDADELGGFRFDSLDAANGPFFIYAGAPGFEVVRSPATAPGGDPLVIELPRAGSILLTVVDPESGDPILGATVKGLRKVYEREMPIPLQVTTDPQALEAAGVPPPHVGLYLLSPAGPRGNTAVISAPGHATRGYVLPTVTAPERAAFRAQLPPEARVTGLVVDPEGRPIAGAQVKLMPPESLRVDLPPVSEKSDAAGRFAIGQLAGGEWSVNASAQHFVPSPPQTLAMRKGRVVEDVRIVLQPAGAIAGVVLSAGQPMAGAGVKAVSVAQAEAVRAAERAGGGRVAMKDRPPLDEHRVVADPQGRFRIDDLQPEPFELTGPPGVSVVVEVKAGETSEVTLLARAKPRIRGRVSDASGPVKDVVVDAQLWFEPLKGWMSDDEPVRTDAQGLFDRELSLTGHYSIAGRQAGTTTQAIELDLTWDQTEWLELTFPGGVVRGRVVEADGGAPIAGATVALGDVSKLDKAFRTAGGKRTAKSDADGRFEFTRVAPQAFAVFVIEDGHVEPPAVRLDVLEGGTPPELVLSLQRGGRIAGHVSALNGAALPEKLRVRAVGLDGQPTVGSAKVQKDGAFECTQLAPGRWRCELVTAEDAPVLQAREATVTVGEVAAAEFEVAF